MLWSCKTARAVAHVDELAHRDGGGTRSHSISKFLGEHSIVLQIPPVSRVGWAHYLTRIVWLAPRDSERV